jgi:hypothetical protein
MDRERSMHAEVKIHSSFYSQDLKGRDHLGDLEEDGRIIIILKCIFKIRE